MHCYQNHNGKRRVDHPVYYHTIEGGVMTSFRMPSCHWQEKECFFFDRIVFVIKSYTIENQSTFRWITFLFAQSWWSNTKRKVTKKIVHLSSRGFDCDFIRVDVVQRVSWWSRQLSERRLFCFWCILRPGHLSADVLVQARWSTRPVLEWLGRFW